MIVNSKGVNYKIEIEKFPFKDSVDQVYYIFKVVCDGETVGSIDFSASRALNFCKISMLSVDKEYRGKGVGRALMMAMEATAVEKSINYVYSFFTGNQHAKELYNKMGYRFREEGESTFIENRVLRRRYEQVIFEDEDYQKLDITKKEK